MPRSHDNATTQKNTGRLPQTGRYLFKLNRDPAASITSWTEEPRPRIANYVAPLVDKRTTCPVAARAGDRERRRVAVIRSIARHHRIGWVRRTRNRATNDGAGCKTAGNAEPDPATAAARLGVVGD